MHTQGPIKLKMHTELLLFLNHGPTLIMENEEANFSTNKTTHHFDEGEKTIT